MVAAELIDRQGAAARVADLGRFYMEYEETRLW